MARMLLSIIPAVKHGRFSFLLSFLLGYLLLSPFIQDFMGLRLLYYLFLTAVLLASIVAIRTNTQQTVIAVCLAVPMVLMIWIAYSHPTTGWRLGANVISFLFFGYIIYSILIFVFTTRQVTHHVIFGAVSVYLLIGVAWSILYVILESLIPGSFSRVANPADPQSSSFIYFSFVTITTLGYGDITPLTSKARSLAVCEAVIGQFYMTVLIAWLVGLYVSQQK